MIVHVLRLTSWEWFKLRRRWMPWILLAVAVVLTQIAVWASYALFHNESLQDALSGGSYSTTHVNDGRTITVTATCADLVNERPPDGLELLSDAQRRDFLADGERFRDESCGGVSASENLREGFVLPSAIPRAVASVFDIAALLVLILTASTLGNEYGWGTLRPAVSGGAGRWPLLLSRLVLLMLLGAGGLVVVGASAAVSSVLASVIPPAESGGLTGSGEWTDAAVTMGKAVYGLAPFVALAALLTVVTRSANSGMGLSLGYFVVELIVVPLLRSFDWGESVSGALIGANVDIWMDGSDALQAFLVLLAYTTVLAGGALWIFQRRDITGATGS